MDVFSRVSQKHLGITLTSFTGITWGLESLLTASLLKVLSVFIQNVAQPWRPLESRTHKSSLGFKSVLVLTVPAHSGVNSRKRKSSGRDLWSRFGIAEYLSFGPVAKTDNDRF